ncbi:MAG: 2-oxoacid:acceptor oxidoreductase subunit alpha, partial [Desulfobacca sp.]|nr:2-oxoacid:acceptor oxidoreductase subunit alpha [Desulfobacca sp.]
MTSQSLNIVIGGEAGQGLVTIGQILAKGLVRSGYFIVVTQGYQSRIRGGHNTYSIRAGSKEICAPEESVDLLVALDAPSVAIHSSELSPGAQMVVDKDWQIEGPGCLTVPFKQLAANKFANILALGVAGSLLGLSEEILEQALEDFFGHKDPSITEENRKALKMAYQWTADQAIPFPRLDSPINPHSRLMINGNEAIALGALSAGLKFLSFYPMTPATSIA